MTGVMVVTVESEVTGAEQSLLNIAPLMGERDVDMMLATVTGGGLEKVWRARGLDFVALCLPRRQGFRPNSGEGYSGVREFVSLPARTLMSVVRIGALARRRRVDVIHSNRLITHLDCALVGRLTRTGSVIELHDIVAPGIGRWAMGVAAVLAGRAVAVSGAVRDQLPRWARGNVVVIPQSVDLTRFGDAHGTSSWRSRVVDSPDDPVIAAIGRIDPEKGLDILIRAVALMRWSGSSAQLVLVGSPGKDAAGECLTGLRELGEQLLGGAFRYLPQVDDVAGVLRAVDVLACPSYEEPFGMIILEAQACGVPVVACDSGGPAEFVDDGETGLLTPPGDVACLAKALGTLLDDPDLAKRVGSAGRDRVHERFTAEVRADRFAALYRELAR